MLDSYRNTIDERHETVTEATGHIDKFFAGEFGDPLLESSFLALEDTEPRSVTLACLSDDEPFLAQIYTSPKWAKRGFATTLIRMSMNALAEAGFQVVNLMVTEGNHAAEHLYAKLGFEPVETLD